MADKIEKRLSFTIVLLGTVAISSLLICGFVNGLTSVEKIALLIVTLGALVLMLYAPMPAPPRINIAKSGDGSFKISIGIVARQTKTVKTAIGVDPRITESSDITDNEKIVRDKLFEIIENGLTIDSCQQSLDLLNKNKSVVKNSWRLTLNKARLLGFLEQFAEAEQIAQDVISEFADDGKAVGSAYEVLSWIEELQEPDETDTFYRQSLEKRKSYVTKGIEFHPHNHALLMNGFEIAVLQGNSEEAADYLDRAILVNRKLTRETLAILESARKRAVADENRLSPKIKQTMEELMKGDKKMKIFKIVRASVLFLLIFLTSGVIVIFGLSNNDNRSRVKEFSRALCPDLEKIGKPWKPVIKERNSAVKYLGTDFGEAVSGARRDGTNFSRAGTGTIFNK